MTGPDSLHREKARLRKIGAIVLALGFGSAGLVYWIGTRSQDARLEQFQESQTRAESRQMEMLYGTSGGLMQDFFTAMKRPGTQATTIIVAAGLIAAGCFYLGRPIPEGE
jgi:hypothetical protein